jgi:16S rRNA (guanine(966)-N(2))-methyltransferase RsmD
MPAKNIPIIAGTQRGRKLWGPSDRSIRPATGMIKEYMFNILQSAVNGAQVLDLFSGTGNLGLEALSRGAESALFVDSSPQAIELIHKNIALLPELKGKTRVLKSDAMKFIKNPPRDRNSFDIIFADPPFPYEKTAAVVNTIDGAEIMKEDGIVIVRYNRDIRDELRLARLTGIKYREFGDSRISIFAFRQSKT